MLGVEFAEAGGWDVGDGDGGEAFELDDDVLVLLDALDDAFNTGEVALGDEDTAADLVEVVAIVEEHHCVILDGGDTHEVPGAFRTQKGDTAFLHGALSGFVCPDVRHLSRWFPATSMNYS